MNWNCCLQYLLQLLRQAFIFPLAPSLSRLNFHWESKALCNASAGICLFHLNCCLFYVESVSPLRLQNTTDDVFPPVFGPQPLLLLLWWDCFRFHCEGTMQQHASAFPPEPPPPLRWECWTSTSIKGGSLGLQNTTDVFSSCCLSDCLSHKPYQSDVNTHCMYQVQCSTKRRNVNRPKH